MAIVRFPGLDKIPVRFHLGIMMFMSCFISYMLRVNISINILAMTEPIRPPAEAVPVILLNSTELDDLRGNRTFASATEAVPDFGPRYNWTSRQQSLLLGSYFWGYLVTSLPAGMLAKIFGETNTVGCSMSLSAIFTALCPLAASVNFWSLFGMRFMLGVVGGLLYPCLHNLIAKWCPPDEKGKFISSLMGGTLGTVITWPLAAMIVETLGWIYAFYIPALITSVIAFLWFLIVADSPEKHTRITVVERQYIEKSLGKSEAKPNVLPPLLCVATSLPFWALLLLHYGNLWGLNFLLTAAPKFMSEILKYNIGKAGILSSLPYLARLISGFIFGMIGDLIRRKNLLTVTAIRKSFCVFSHIIPGLFLIGLIFVGFHPFWCVAIITMSLGFNGASTMTNLQNSQDLSPNYAGTIYGIINFVGTTTGFITPLLLAYFTEEKSTMEEWKNIFVIGAAIYILPAIVFMIFGSGKVQDWNDHVKTDTNEKNKAQQTS